MAKAYLIDPKKRTISEVEYNSLTEMRELIGGYIELAYMHTNGDVLYVDENGMNKPNYRFQYSHRPDQDLYGNGVIVGKEVEGPEYPDGYTTLDPQMSLLQVTVRVRFL